MSDFTTPWTVAHQAPLFTGLSRQEYWSGLLFPSPGDLPNPGIEQVVSKQFMDQVREINEKTLQEVQITHHQNEGQQ